MPDFNPFHTDLEPHLYGINSLGSDYLLRHVPRREEDERDDERDAWNDEWPHTAPRRTTPSVPP